MTHAVRGFGLAAILVLVFILAATPNAKAQSTSSTAANVYIQIQGPAGAVYGFSASSAGKLSAIPSAPWKPAGEIIGSNGPRFITLGADILHSYEILSDGAINMEYDGQLQYEGLFHDYPGGGCGSGTNGVKNAVLDHSGQYVYILNVNGGDGTCAAYQTWQIVNSAVNNGLPNYDGDTEFNTSQGQTADIPSILGNESFAYADLILSGASLLKGHSSSVIGFQRESAGTLELMQFHETDPALIAGAYVPYRPDASPTGNYLVLQLYANGLGMGQLGSYTVDSNGNISSTNTSSNMPSSAFSITGTTFSPSGNLFVTYADNGENAGAGNGIQIFNFNGAAPLTPYKTLLNGTPIDQVAWDSSNHLYAISKSTNELYVFTVTPTSVTEDTSWSIGAPFKMIVVSK
jgi:hypothetical protein